MDLLIGLLLIALVISPIVMIINWCIEDAHLRGKSSILVLSAVIFFFPWGWIAWLIFRPPPKSSNNLIDND